MLRNPVEASYSIVLPSSKLSWTINAELRWVILPCMWRDNPVLHVLQTRLKYLKKILNFLEDSDKFLPSSQVIFKANCLDLNMHYTVRTQRVSQMHRSWFAMYFSCLCQDQISVAPSIVQHEIKSLHHRLVQLTPVDNLLAINTADLFQPTKEPCKSSQYLFGLYWYQNVCGYGVEFSTLDG